MSWLKSTKKALYLMEGDSYLQKVDYQSGNSADELKLDIPFAWFDNSDRPRTLVLDFSARPEPPQFSQASSPFKISAQRYAFLDLIAYAEGTDRLINGQRDGYNIMFSFETFTDFSDHPRRIINANGYSSSAAGRYQFLTETWDECKEALNLSDFRDSNQDAAALHLIQRRGAMDYVDRGDIRGACEILSWEWASLPYNDRGDGRYGQPTVKFRDLEKVYEQNFKYYVLGNVTTAAEVNLNVPYLSQRDNQRDPDKTCNVTCVAMVLKYFNLSGNTPISQLEDELDRYMKDRGWNRYLHSDLVKLQEAYGLKSRFTTKASWHEIKQHLANGNPVIISGKFTSAGHIIVLRGYDATGFWVNDPYGEWWSWGYDRNRRGVYDNKGENLHYSYNLCSRVSYTGPNNTWAHFPSKP